MPVEVHPGLFAGSTRARTSSQSHVLLRKVTSAAGKGGLLQLAGEDAGRVEQPPTPGVLPRPIAQLVHQQPDGAGLDVVIVRLHQPLLAVVSHAQQPLLRDCGAQLVVKPAEGDDTIPHPATVPASHQELERARLDVHLDGPALRRTHLVVHMNLACALQHHLPRGLRHQ